jgi:acyl-CoA hydrolase
VAALRGKSDAGRAMALLHIADPAFREPIEREIRP